MATLIRLNTAKGPVLFEVSPSETNVRDVSVVQGVIESTQKLEDGLRQLIAFADAAYKSFADLADKIERAELEVGLNVNGKGSIYFVQTEAAASVKVKLVFKLAPPKP